MRGVSPQYRAKLEMLPGISGRAADRRRHRKPPCRAALGLPADLFGDRLSDLAGPFLQRRRVASLDEQARLGFGAGVAQQDAAALRL